MQKHLSVKLIAVFSLLLFFLTLTVTAQSNSSGITENLEDMMAEAQQLLTKLSPKNIFDMLSSNILSYIKQLSKSFGIAIAVIIMSSVFTAIHCEGEHGGIFSLIAKSLVIISVFPPIISCFGKVAEHIEALCGFMLSFIPTAVMLHTASGNTLSASVLSTTGAGAITVLQIVSVGLIIPMIKAVCSLGIINLLCKRANLSGIASALKSVSIWIIGLFFTLFSGILSLQSILQSGADNLAIKGLKYSAAKLIPIAGGMVSESMKTVISAVGFIKSVTGISGIVFILYTIIPPVCLVLVTKFYLCLLSAFAKTSGDSDLSSFFDGINASSNLLLALLISCSISFVILLALFIKTNVSI